MRHLAFFLLLATSSWATAQTWIQVADAPLSGLCYTLSADTCHITRDGGMLFVTRNGVASSDSTQTMFTTEWFLDLDFPTAQVGYACGGSHYGVYKEIIVKTVDGGTTWFPLTHDEHGWFTFDRIDFVTEDIGFVTGNAGIFLKTTVGGITFNQVDLQFPGINNVVDVYFDGNVGYACTYTALNGQNNDDLYRILKSTDLGDTWSILYADTLLDRVYTTDRRVNSVRFLGEFGLACGNNGLVLLTVDGGASWTETTVLSDTTFFFDLEMVNEQTAFIVTASAYAGPLRNTLQTNDGGITWTALPHEFRSISVKGASGYAIDGTGQLYKNANVLLGLDDQEVHTLALFPNPVTGDVAVILPETFSSGVCSLFDANGRVVLRQSVTARGSITLHLGALAPGAYTVQVSDKGSAMIYRERLVKQ